MSRFLKIIVNLVLIAAIIVAAALLVPPLMGIDTVMNDNTGTDTNLPVGSVAYGQSADADELETGDRIIYSEGSSDYIYEITDMDASAGAYKVRDPYNSNSDTQNITIQKSVPKVALVVPFIGYGAIALQSTEGLIVTGLGIIFLIILFILSEIWRKDRDEDEDEEFDEEVQEYEEEEDEEEEEEVLSRRERRRLKKEEKRRRKMEKKRLQEEEEEEEEEEFPETGSFEEADAGSDILPEQDSDVTAEEAASAAAAEASAISEPEQVPDATIVMPDISTLEQGNLSDERKEGAEEISGGEEAQPSEEAGSPDAAEEEEKEAGEEPAVPETPAEPEALIAPEATEASQETVKEDAINPESVLHAPTVEELLAKAQAQGDTPEVKEDKENQVTLLDYSDIL